jgi:hypothetical protein
MRATLFERQIRKKFHYKYQNKNQKRQKHFFPEIPEKIMQFIDTEATVSKKGKIIDDSETEEEGEGDCSDFIVPDSPVKKKSKKRVTFISSDEEESGSEPEVRPIKKVKTPGQKTEAKLLEPMIEAIEKKHRASKKITSVKPTAPLDLVPKKTKTIVKKIEKEKAAAVKPFTPEKLKKKKR